MKHLLVLLFSAQLGRCAALCAHDPRYDEHALQITGTLVASTNGADRLFLVGSEGPPSEYERSIMRWPGTNSAAITIRVKHIVGEGFTAGRYTVAGNYENEWGALFVPATGGASNRAFVALPIVGPARWLPLAGARPRGLYVYNEGEATHILDVDTGGVTRKWLIAGRKKLLPDWWNAHVLPDGTIAVISLQSADEGIPARVVLRHLEPDQAEIAETILDEGKEYLSVSSALGADGALAVAIDTTEGVHAGIVGPEGHMRWHRLTADHQNARRPAVTAAGTEFVVGWWEHTDDGLTLRARTLNARMAGLVAVTNGTSAQRGQQLPAFTIDADAEELTFVWQGDGIRERRLPAQLAGYELLEDLRAWLCRPDGAQMREPHPSPR